MKSVRKSNTSRLTLATLATLAGLSVVGVFAPSDAAAQVAPTSAQCNSSAFARANPALTAAADANFTQSTCRANCEAGLVFDTNKCDSDDFYASICGHIEAAKLRSVSPLVQATSRCKTTIQARAAGTPTATAARALPTTQALGPDQAIVVAPNQSATSASGATANATSNRRLMNYGRNHKTTASMTSSLAGRNAALSAEKGLKHSAGTAAPVSAAHQRWTTQAQAGNLAIESCEEYAWARSYTFSLVEDMLATKAADPVAQAAALYATVGGQPATTAILARAITSAGTLVRDTSGSNYRTAGGSTISFGGLLTGRRAKNELVGLSVAPVPMVNVQMGLNLRPDLLQPSGAINQNRPLAKVSAITLADPTLLDAMVAVRDVTYDNSAAANQFWVAQTRNVAGDAEFRARLLKMKRNILSLVNERSAIVEAYEQGLRSHLKSCTFQDPIDEVPVEANLNPLWDPSTVMNGPAEQLLAQTERLRYDPAAIDAGAAAPRLRGCVPGVTVWGLPDYQAWLGSAEGRAFTGGIARRLIAQDMAIEAELQRARAAGCFATDRALNQCDWDAESFMVEVRKVIGIDRGADYGVCVDALGTGNFLDPATGQPIAGGTIATNNTHGFAYHRINDNCTQQQASTTVWVESEQADGTLTVPKNFECGSQAGAGYAADPKALRTMIRCEAALAQAQQAAAAQLLACGKASAEALDEAGIGWNADSNTISERGNQGDTFADGFDEGSDLFGASMQFTNAWSVAGIGPNDDPAHLNSACSLRPSMTNTFNAKASVFGSSFTLANAVTSVRVTDAQTTSLGNSSVIVMGQEFVTTPVSAAANTYNIVAADAVAGPYDLISLSMTFAVGFVPLTVAAGATGQLGVDYRFGDDGAASCNGGDFSVSNTLRPHAKVDAYASASINLAIVEAGIKGVVNLIDLSLPLGGTLSSVGGLLAVDNAVRQTLTALSGYLAAFVEVDFWVDSVYFEVPLFSWEGIKSVETLHRDGVSGITIPGLRVL